MAKRGPRPGPSNTRDEIIAAAREQFASGTYARTTVRSIADAAGVHPSLLHHYFTSKQDLYRAAIDLPVDPWDVLARLADETPREELSDALVRHFITTWRDPESGIRLRAIARQTFGDPAGADMARTHLGSVVIPRFAKALGIPELNVAAAFSHLIGLVLTDAVIGLGQVTGATDEQIVHLVAPVIDEYVNP